MAGMTMTEKILAAHASADRAEPGDVVWVETDILMTHDVCGPPATAIFKEEFGGQARVWNPDRVVIIPDHFIFTKDPDARENLQTLRRFVAEQGIRHFYDAGGDDYAGVCHVAMAERGHTRPGEVLFGTDSHTCTAGAFGLFATGIGNTDAAFIMGSGKLWVRVPETMRFVFDGPMPAYLMAKDLILAVLGRIGVDGASYRAMEFAGSTIERLGMPERMTLCNMAIEAGGKSGIVACDQTCRDYLKDRTSVPYQAVFNDPDAVFHSQHVFEVADIAPLVAKPHSPGRVAAVTEVADCRIDRCYIGSCTGGKTEDFIKAAMILDGNEVVVETCLVPATTSVANDLKQMRHNGRTLQEVFEAAGARVGPPSCAACLGGPKDTFGRLDADQVCISTTNRNFPGRMGSSSASIFLASPCTVAASALTGKITDPRKFLV